LILFLILFMTIGIRVYRLSVVPPSPSLDEVSICYNAYSIIKTGRDEYGNFIPILLRAYDDFRPAGYVYVTIPSVLLFGLNIFAVRLPSVLLSVMSIICIYFIFFEIGKVFRIDDTDQTVNIASLFGILFMAISPWDLYLNRLGHEVNFGFFLTCLFLYLFLKSLNEVKTRKWFVYVAIVFGLSFNSYQSQKIIMPILLLFLITIFRNNLWSRRQQLLIPIITGILFIFPFILVSFSPSGLLRFKATSVLYNNPEIQKSLILYNQARIQKNIINLIRYHRYTVSLQIIADNYLVHFRPEWLFSGKLKEDHKIPFTGLLYPVDLIFIIIGILWLFKYKRKILILITGITIISPIPGALTTQAPHAMRTMISLVPYAIFFGFGGVGVLNLIPKKYCYYILSIIFGAYLFLNLPNLYSNYFYIFPRSNSESFQIALTKSLSELKFIKDNYEQIIISNQNNLYQSYMFYLFNIKYDPKKYAALGGTKSGGYAENHKIDNLVFRKIDWEKDRLSKNSLLVGNPGDFTGSVNIINKFDYLDGKDGVWFVTTK
jgi:4-amino-4-deoxy-L-arabinose transferase-like glycosyltransferase